VALFQTAPAGSGIISPIWPDLTLSYTYDGLGLIFSCPSHNFLYVFNGVPDDDGTGPPDNLGGHCLGRKVQYAAGLFTPWIPKFGGAYILGLTGPKTWKLLSYPRGLGFDFFQKNHATDRSPYGFPSSYTSGNGNLSLDQNYDTNNTGDGRRAVSWPPLRALLYSKDGALQQSAWLATLGWNWSQLARPLAHIGAALNQQGQGINVPFTPFGNVQEYTSGFLLNGLNDSNGQRIQQGWDCENSKRLAPDLLGVPRNWNAGDPAHNDVIPQFALACMDHPLGAVLLWLLYSWYVQGMPPFTFNTYQGTTSMYGYPWGQERSYHWSASLWLYAYLVGIQWADPNLIRDWCGGLKPAHNNSGLGWRPRDALRWWTDAYAGPDYGGPSCNEPRRDITACANDKSFGDRFPRILDGSHFVYNGKDYDAQIASSRGFHRSMTLWSIPEAMRAHDYIQMLDPTEFLFDPTRIASLKTWSRQRAQIAIDHMLIDF
jgi:hypothetical protein